MGLFGNMFDFDGDGEATLFEETLGLCILDEVLNEEEEEEEEEEDI